MKKYGALLVAIALPVTVGTAPAQNQSSQDTKSAPTEFQNSIRTSPPSRRFPKLPRIRPVCPLPKPVDRLLTCPGRWALRWTVQATPDRLPTNNERALGPSHCTPGHKPKPDHPLHHRYSQSDFRRL